jgi:hypothetical protein
VIIIRAQTANLFKLPRAFASVLHIVRENFRGKKPLSSKSAMFHVMLTSFASCNKLKEKSTFVIFYIFARVSYRKNAKLILAKFSRKLKFPFKP